MKNTDTFSILFWLRQANTKNRQAPLYARITVNGKRAELSLKRKVTISDWDSNKNKLKGLSEQNKLLNNYIEQVNSRLFECYQKLQSGNKLVTSNIIKAVFLGNEETRHTLSDIIEYHNTHFAIAKSARPYDETYVSILPR